MALLEAKKYDDAIKVLGRLTNYRDSAKQLNEAKYQKALLLMGQKKYQDAEKIFTELGNYSDSAKQLKECKYQRALGLVKDKKYTQAVPIFKELGNYSDSVDQWKAAMYSYVLAHRNNTDKTTYEYLKELKRYNYQNSSSIYDNLYQWTVSLIAANTDRDNFTSISTSVSKTTSYFHFYFKLDGGPPGVSVTLTHKVYWPDGGTTGSSWYWEDKTRGSYFGVQWDEGLYDPRYAKSGDLIIRIYVKGTNELIGQATVKLT